MTEINSNYDNYLIISKVAEHLKVPRTELYKYTSFMDKLVLLSKKISEDIKQGKNYLVCNDAPDDNFRILRFNTIAMEGGLSKNAYSFNRCSSRIKSIFEYHKKELVEILNN